MRIYSAALLASLASVGIAQAQQLPRPSSLPDVTLECDRSFSSYSGYPFEAGVFGVTIDGDNFDKPPVRYRLQVVSSQTLKVIEWPNSSERRKEYGKGLFDLSRDFTNKHPIVGWREQSSTEIKIFTVDFENKLFSIMKVPITTQYSRMGLAGVEINKCR